MLRPTELAIRPNCADDVVIARVDLAEGTWLAQEQVRARQRVPAGHKIATHDVERGAPVRRYGQIIGFATTAPSRSRRPARASSELVLRAASGAKTKSEQWGYGEDEFAPRVLGATM